MLRIGTDKDVIVRGITEADLPKSAEYSDNKNVSLNLCYSCSLIFT